MLQLVRLTSAIGAEVRGVGLRQALRDGYAASDIAAAFAEHKVLLFRGQGSVTPEEHVSAYMAQWRSRALQARRRCARA
jgi:alpha-ketoglutarate-dependent taurine dioxygenase